MARKPRIHYENAIYHIIVRGNNRECLLLKDDDKRQYLRIVADYKNRYAFKLYAYVIMDNHVHLLIKIATVPLAKIMQSIQQRFTQYYNWHYHRTGHVFEQRYKAFICTDDNYLLTLLYYIHQNPIRAKIKDSYNYPWSSHRSYFTGISDLVDIDFILDILSSNRNHAISLYCSMIGVPINKTDFKNETATPLQPSSMKINNPPLTWSELINKISQNENIPLDQLIGKCRIRNIVAARRQVVFYALENNLLTRQQLAEKLLVDPSRITQLYYEFASQEINSITKS